MKCVVCSSEEHRVLETVEAADGSIRRRRKCDRCGHRWRTFERADDAPALDRRALLEGLANLQAIVAGKG